MKPIAIRIFNVFMIVVVVAGLFSCSSNKGNKVGFLLHQEEGRWSNDIEYLMKHAKAAGVELIIKKANGNESIQLEQARQLVKEGAGVIMVVAVNQNTAAGIVRIAHDANLKVVAYDRVIINCDLDYLITYEYETVGKKLAEYAHQKVPNGDYVMLWGDASDNNARLMRKGQEEYLQQFVDKGDVNLIYRSFTENWSNVNARKAMQKILDFSGHKIDVVIASNDNIGLAALAAFDENNIERPKVITGQDANLNSCRSIVRNGQTVTIYKSTNQMAKEAIDLASNILKGNRITNINGTVFNNRINVPTLFLPPQVVDKTNIDRIVIEDGMYSRDEIYSN